MRGRRRCAFSGAGNPDFGQQVRWRALRARGFRRRLAWVLDGLDDLVANSVEAGLRLVSGILKRSCRCVSRGCGPQLFPAARLSIFWRPRDRSRPAGDAAPGRGRSARSRRGPVTDLPAPDSPTHAEHFRPWRSRTKPRRSHASVARAGGEFHPEGYARKRMGRGHRRFWIEARREASRPAGLMARIRPAERNARGKATIHHSPANQIIVADPDQRAERRASWSGHPGSRGNDSVASVMDGRAARFDGGRSPKSAPIAFGRHVTQA